MDGDEYANVDTPKPKTTATKEVTPNVNGDLALPLPPDEDPRANLANQFSNLLSSDEDGDKDDSQSLGIEIDVDKFLKDDDLWADDTATGLPLIPSITTMPTTTSTSTSTPPVAVVTPTTSSTMPPDDPVRGTGVCGTNGTITSDTDTESELRTDAAAKSKSNPSEDNNPTPEPTTLVMVNHTNASRINTRRFCLNAACKSGGGGEELTIASSEERYYYGYAKTGAKKWVCDLCKQRVKDYLKEVLRALEERRPVCNVPTPYRDRSNVIVDLDDDDDDDDIDCDEASRESGPKNSVKLNAFGDGTEPPSPTSEQEYLDLPPGTDINAVVDACIQSLDLSAQKAMYKSWLQEQVRLGQASLARSHADVARMQRELHRLVDIVNRIRRPSYQIEMFSPLDVPYNPPAIPNIAKKATSRRSTSGIPRNPIRMVPTRDYSLSDPEDDDEDDVVPLKRKKSFAKRLELDPAKEVIPRTPPPAGGRIYVMEGSSLEPWHMGTVVGARDNAFGGREYEVQLDPSISRNKDRPSRILVTARRLAYPQPIRHVVPVGTRVLAQFKDKRQLWEEGELITKTSFHFYAGIVAETPATQNRFRYLIFFDDGYAMYAGQHGLLLVVENNSQVWFDVHPHTQDFIREYLDRFPERNLVRLARGQIITIEWNQRAFTARVLEVDGSMVKIWYEINKRQEWVYRGSNRFDKSLWPEITTPIGASDAITNGPSTSATASSSRDDDRRFATSNTMNLPHSEPPTIMNTSNLVEFEGRIIRQQLPSGVRIRPIDYEEHICRSGCAPTYVPSRPDLFNVNPLLHPMYFGWGREVAKAPPRRLVYYRAPCGLRLRDAEEVQAYVFTTECRLGLDLFSFDVQVEPFGEFTPAVQKYHIADLSYGKELVPVQCVNSIDVQPPDYIEYTPRRQPGKDVRINTEQGFMVCCDCTDDCLDQSKCACWQLTLEGTELTTGPPPGVAVGYEQRRLKDPVPSGIYECNKYCKCRNTCSNRVVQYPLRWKLQVFKTRTKGWGVRPLQDIPEGAFICVYAGQLLHENSANEDGRKYGDEYFAELDYVEATEQHKEGYEEEALDPDDPQRLLHGTRRLFGADEQIYVMDAKSIGNIGRYMNHSCEPNVFVQNVFVDTHDLRFPWIAFFAFCPIRAGTELTWDYNYQVASVQDKVMYCYCGTELCRGRLL